MTAEHFVYRLFDALESLGVPYMVGTFSSNLYGLPRCTLDADFVIKFDNVPVSRLRQQLGPGFHVDTQTSFEPVSGAYRIFASHVASAFRGELFPLSDDPHDRERFARRRRAAFPEREGFVATPEDVVVTKLRWSKGGSRPRDIEDVRNVIIGQKVRLDWDYIRRWCAAHGTTELLEKVRREAEAD
jgi:hypothetical protein